MWTDVVDLREFYGEELGRTAQRLIRRKVREFWPDTAHQRMLGVGYATPYLGVFRGESERVMAAMPAGQGVLHWPVGERGLTMLCEETHLPLPDLSFDRVLMVHAIECAEQLRPMLREVWRVMADSGRLLIVVPNRRGLWARFETTPLGHGRPFSHGQLTKLLRDTMFMPMESGQALFMPPTKWRMLQGSANAVEKIGGRVFPAAAGVIVMEATKQMYAQSVSTAPARARRFGAVAERPRSFNRGFEE